MKKHNQLSIPAYLFLGAALILAIRYFDVLIGAAARLWSIAFPLVLGGVLAYILNIVLRKLERIWFPHSTNKAVKAAKRPVCILLSLLLILAVFFLILLLVVPEMVRAVMLVGQNIPGMVERGLDWLAARGITSAENARRLEELQIDWKKIGENVWHYLQTGLGGVLSSTVSVVSGAVGGFVNFMVALIFAFYILGGKERLGRQGKRVARAYLKPAWAAKAKRVLTTLDETFSSFIVGQVTEALILGTLCTLGMLLCPLIPIVGAYLGAAVGAFMILTQSPLQALLFLLFIVVLQQLEGNLIYPRVVGSSIGLPGIWVLAAVTVGGGLLGIPGMLLGVPLAASFYKLLAQDVDVRSERMGENREES